MEAIFLGTEVFRIGLSPTQNLNFFINSLSFLKYPSPRIPLSAPAAAPPNEGMSVTKKYCIIDTYTIHTCMLQNQGPGSLACFRTKVQDHRYVHHTHMHQSQGSRIIDMCIIQACIVHTCVMIKDNRCMHHTYMHQGQGSWICNAAYIVHHTRMHQSQGSGTLINASYMHVSGPRIMHHTYASYINIAHHGHVY